MLPHGVRVEQQTSRIVKCYAKLTIERKETDKEYNLLCEIYNNFKVIIYYLQNERSFTLLILYATNREATLLGTAVPEHYRIIIAQMTIPNHIFIIL